MEEEAITLGPDGIAFDCPFCNQSVIAGNDVATGNGVVLHKLPTCEQYSANEPDEYLRLARIRMSQ